MFYAKIFIFYSLLSFLHFILKIKNKQGLDPLEDTIRPMNDSNVYIQSENNMLYFLIRIAFTEIN